MTTRTEQVQQITHIMAENLTYDADGTYSEDHARAQNRAGWSFETSSRELERLGHVIRHEGVELTESEFQQAWADANRIAYDEE